VYSGIMLSVDNLYLGPICCHITKYGNIAAYDKVADHKLLGHDGGIRGIVCALPRSETMVNYT